MVVTSDQENTLERVLQYAPELLKKLRKEHGERVTAGETREILPSVMGAPEGYHTFEAEILVDGKKRGLYEHVGSMWSVSGQKYNGQKTGDIAVHFDVED
ncbi:hypothetical protein HY497_00960 [Candidatus Woesearchaeota archaeon]|nr:hypothetical protein [Candidatus Woesearchaeota archaeon]